jgi:prepilin-type N-terminal cleavage/methylation domain-containing protein
MNPSAKSDSVRRRLPVRWLDTLADGPLAISLRKLRRVAGTPQPAKAAADLLCRGGGQRSTRPALGQRTGPAFVFRGRGGFTLLEMMVVITIIGFMAALALPHVSGFGRANSMSAANRQLLDDCALARRRAMINRSTVYMVFVPPNLWSNTYILPQINGNQLSNLVTHQYAAYALVSLGSVGDQPGRHYPQYVTDWRVLPAGVFFAPFQFNLVAPSKAYVYTTNTLTGAVVTSVIQPWANVPLPGVPFPSLYYTNNTTTNLPCIGFTPAGTLTTPYINQYIVLDRGSVFYAQGSNGAPILQPANWVESPPGNETNNANLIQIDWMTARAKVVQNQMQ